MIQDQRHLTGGRTVEEVRRRWHKFIDAANERRRDRGLALVVLYPTGRFVPAYVNHGRWVALCECGGGMGAWEKNPEAACLDCGRVYEVTWPSPQITQRATALLEARPRESNRNWVPWQESPELLAAENRLHLEP